MNHVNEVIGKEAIIGNTKGTIVDETKNMIIIRDKDKRKKSFIKNNHKIKLIINEEAYETNKEDMQKRPQEKIKVRVK